MKECLISIDIEATGPTPGKYCMYELGACVVGKEHLQFGTHIKFPLGGGYQEAALKAVGIEDIREIEFRDAPSPKEAMTKFLLWVREVAKNAKPVFVANNAPFDWMFVAYYFDICGIENPFGHSALDMKAYFMGLTKCTWKDATLKRMAAYAGVKFKKLPHRALEDAIFQSAVFAGMQREAGRNSSSTEALS